MAAAQDYPHAVFMLGIMHGQGFGVVQDRAKAKQYYEKADALGYPKAKEMLAAVTQSPLVIEGIASDPEYGYKLEKAIRTGGKSGVSQHAYLRQLRGPEGQVINYERVGVCGAYKDDTQPFGDALVDCYTVTYEGQGAPVTLYLDFYKSEKLWAPQGFTFK